MQEPRIPIEEKQRLLALHRLNLLDTPPEERFDRLTRIARQYFKVPIVLVSLVDADRQWFKSAQGLSVCETGRNVSFCGHAILSEEPLVVPNALQDPRFDDNPLVTGPPNIRFYAGRPVHAPTGERVGTLCLIDVRPRELSRLDLQVLSDLAGAVESEMARSG